MVGNLSSNQDFFVAIREAGTMQRLVALLEAGSHSRVTEIAAKTLANLAVDESNQTAIRLSGGIPPLMRLLTLKPTDQVSCPDHRCATYMDRNLNTAHMCMSSSKYTCFLYVLVG